MNLLQKDITSAWKHRTLRAPKMVRGLIESPFMVKLSGDKAKRRIYEDWNRTKKRKNPAAGQKWQPPVLTIPTLVLHIKGSIYDLDKQHTKVLIDAGLPKVEA